MQRACVGNVVSGVQHTCGVQSACLTASCSKLAACMLLQNSPNRPMQASTSTVVPLPARIVNAL